MGSDSIEGAIELQRELQELFDKEGFLLRKWNSSQLSVLQHIKPELRDAQSSLSLSNPDEYTKTLEIECNSTFDQFCLTVADLPPIDIMTKRALVSDLAKTFDVLGWYSPTIVKAKIFCSSCGWKRWTGMIRCLMLYLMNGHGGGVNSISSRGTTFPDATTPNKPSSPPCNFTDSLMLQR